MKRKITAFILTLLMSSFSYADTVSSTTVTKTEEVPSSPPVVVTPDANATTKTTVTESTTTISTSDADTKIIADIYDRYAKDSALIGTKLTVVSSNGNVILSGTVTMQSQADAAVQDAKAIAGVNSVTSNIVVTTNPPTTTQQAPTTKY